MKEDLFSDEVFVFTPKGDVLNFPRGRDGDRLRLPHPLRGRRPLRRRARQRQLVPLRYQLRNGDTVEIITTDQPDAEQGLAQARQDQPRARRASALDQGPAAQRAASAVGREILERDLGAPPARARQAPQETGSSSEALHELGSRTRRRCSPASATARCTTHAGARQARCPQDELERRARAARRARCSELIRLVSRQPKGGVQVSGVEDVLVRFGRCCDAAAGRAHRSASSPAAAASPCTPSTARGCWRAIRSAASRWCGTSGATGSSVRCSIEVTCVDSARPAGRDDASRSASAGVNITARPGAAPCPTSRRSTPSR